MSDTVIASTTAPEALAAALNVVELAISLGAQHWDRTAPGPLRDRLWKDLRSLMDKREEIEGLILRADFDAPAAVAARKALDRIAADNEKVAGHLPSFTGWLNKIAGLLGQADKIIAQVKKLTS